jgi:hypothetical protein
LACGANTVAQENPALDQTLSSAIAVVFRRQLTAKVQTFQKNLS